MDTYRQALLNYLQVDRQLSPRTVTAYLYDYDQLIQFLKASGGYDIRNLTLQDARYYLSYLIEKKQKKSSIQRQLTSLGQAFAFFKKQGFVYSNPFIYLTKIKGDQPLPDFFYEIEITNLLDSLSAGKK